MHLTGCAGANAGVRNAANGELPVPALTSHSPNSRCAEISRCAGKPISPRTLHVGKRIFACYFCAMSTASHVHGHRVSFAIARRRPALTRDFGHLLDVATADIRGVVGEVISLARRHTEHGLVTQVQETDTFRAALFSRSRSRAGSSRYRAINASSASERPSRSSEQRIFSNTLILDSMFLTDWRYSSG